MTDWFAERCKWIVNNMSDAEIYRPCPLQR